MNCPCTNPGFPIIYERIVLLFISPSKIRNISFQFSGFIFLIRNPQSEIRN